ncbi:MAG: DUF2188 domain-containing protein [Planctomycetaceae bacterium]|nr:DUF2188 domain-containing protein [Planctomycetaceae bacterium]
MDWIRRLGIKALFRALLRQGLPHAADWAQGLVEPAVHSIVRTLVGWYKRALISYGVAAGLALISVFSICAALTQGLVALGVPPWAAHLSLAAVTGLLAFGFVKRAEAKPRLASGKAKGGSESESRTFNIRIVADKPRSRPARSRARAKAPRPRRVVDVHPNENGWEVSQSPAPRKKRVYANKSRAVKAAMAAARKRSAQVVIHGGNGRIREMFSPTGARDN